MIAPDAVATMVRLMALGWGVRRIARKLGCSHMTIRRARCAGAPSRTRGRDPGHSPVRDAARPSAADRLRLELVVIAEETVRVFLFVATLGYSRRNFVAAFHNERQGAWLDGLERAFRRHFGGVPEEVLLDNARPLVTHHDPQTREVVFNDRFHAFARYWGFRPKACAPYGARTKGKDERGVGYVKRNAVAGRGFASPREPPSRLPSLRDRIDAARRWAELEGHLARWMREVADARVHGTTGDAPIERFRRDELAALKAPPGRPPFRQLREVIRRVHADGCIDLDTNHYRVPPARPWSRLLRSRIGVADGASSARWSRCRSPRASCASSMPASRWRVMPNTVAGASGPSMRRTWSASSPTIAG